MLHLFPHLRKSDVRFGKNCMLAHFAFAVEGFGTRNEVT